METKRINEAVKNNPEKLPEVYLIQISKDEWVGLKSKFSTSKWGGKANPPTAFPEKGLCMLATILKSPQATGASFTINGSVLGLTKKEPERQAVRRKGAAGRPTGLCGSGEPRTKSTPRSTRSSTLPRFGIHRHAGAELFLRYDRALVLNLGSSYSGHFKGDCC
jgi:hypothetical protein